MKKSLCLLSVALIVLSSYSKVNKNLNVENSILPKTVKYTSASYPEDNYTATFAYDGNKIKSSTSDNGWRIIFTYTGNTITKVEKYQKDVLRLTITFIYENNKIKSSLTVVETAYFPRKKRIDYTYNPDGTISLVEVSIDPITQVETRVSSSVFTLDANGNIVKIVFDGDDDWNSSTIEYDAKNNPYKNILGYTLLLNAEVFNQEKFNTINNITKLVKKDDKKNVIKSITTYQNTYDENNFLTKSEIKSRNGKVNRIYEYTY